MFQVTPRYCGLCVNVVFFFVLPIGSWNPPLHIIFRDVDSRRWLLPDLCWFLAWLFDREHADFLPKRQLTFTRLHGVISENREMHLVRSFKCCTRLCQRKNALWTRQSIRPSLILYIDMLASHITVPCSVMYFNPKIPISYKEASKGKMPVTVAKWSER
jgi:hypothetical protein